jgi:hypothetical protein
MGASHGGGPSTGLRTALVIIHSGLSVIAQAMVAELVYLPAGRQARTTKTR